MRDSVRGPGTSMMGVAWSGASHGFRTSMRQTMRAPAFAYVIRNSVRPPRQELGPRAGSRVANRDPMRHHVSRSGFGCTCGILCRSSMPGPGASLGILTPMRDSIRAQASSYVVWNSVRPKMHDPGPSPGPGPPPGIQCGTTFLDRDYERYMRHSLRGPGTRTGPSEFHAGWTCLPPPSTVCEAPVRSS